MSYGTESAHPNKPNGRFLPPMLVPTDDKSDGLSSSINDSYSLDVTFGPISLTAVSKLDREESWDRSVCFRTNLRANNSAFELQSMRVRLSEMIPFRGTVCSSKNQQARGDGPKNLAIIFHEKHSSAHGSKLRDGPTPILHHTTLASHSQYLPTSPTHDGLWEEQCGE